MSHRAEVLQFIANVKIMVADEATILIMSLLGVGPVLADICRAVEREFQPNLTPDERVYIATEIKAWLRRIDEGTDCFCGQCKRVPIDIKPESVSEMN